MLIHLGNNEFIDLSECVAIVNLATIDPVTRETILASVRGKLDGEPHAAVLTAGGTWIGSTLSPDALSHRGRSEVFGEAFYRRPLPAKQAVADHDDGHETGDNEDV
ncbi:MAG TPA: hypothetical protein PLP29_14545 [Candidatus Ozemobacteraceae bacterium]|nr:hypothetical protein [Candidatus Ozemobacteraceae bacterium]